MIHARSSEEDIIQASTKELGQALITCDGFGADVKKTALAALLLRVGGFPAVEAVLAPPWFGDIIDAPLRGNNPVSRVRLKTRRPHERDTEANARGSPGHSREGHREVLQD